MFYKSDGIPKNSDLNVRFPSYCHTRLHLGFSAKLRIWQASACKMEPQSGNIFGQNRPDPADPTTRRVSLKSPISQLLLIRCSSNLNGRVARPFPTDHNSSKDICSCNLCPGDNCHSLKSIVYISFY